VESKIGLTSMALNAIKRHNISFEEMFIACSSGMVKNSSFVPGTLISSANFKDKTVFVLYSLNKNGRAIIINCWSNVKYIN
jgi:hypothetical protein